MTPEQQALLNKARDSLRAARILAADGLYDFAASRAYYAMFYAAEALLMGNGLAFSRHSAVIAAFGEHFAKTKRLAPEFHRYLIEAHDSRNVGDYDIGPSLNANEAAEVIARAERFLVSGGDLLGRPPADT